MTYDISISENGKYIVCRVIGPMTVKTAQESSKEMDSLSRAKNIKRFLYDVREAPNTSANYKNYQYAYQDMDDIGLQRDVRSAILTGTDDTSHDFVGTVAQNAGFNVLVFNDEDAAIAWLNEEISK